MKKIQMIKMGLVLGTILVPSLAAANTIGTVTADSLNMRNKPSMSGEVVKKVGYGATLNMISREDSAEGWYKVQLENSSIAYVKEDYVKISRIAGVVNEDNLNYRSYPSLSQSKIMTKLPKGTEVVILYRTGDFYKVMYNGSYGFVYAIYLDVPFSNLVPVQDISGVKEIQSSIVEVPKVEVPKVEVPKNDSSYIQEDTINTQQGSQESPAADAADSTDSVDSADSVDSVTGSPVTLFEGTQIVSYGMQFIGNPYVYGGNDLITGVDCSGFTQQVMKAFDISIPRTSRQQSKVGLLIEDAAMMQPGDLVFFGTSAQNIDHVGIYIGDNYMVHSGTVKTGIIVSNISERGFSPVQVVRRMIK